MKTKFPAIIVVTMDENCDGKENLLAWTSLDSAESGRVATYKLVEELDKREVTEVRRQGAKTWFKP